MCWDINIKVFLLKCNENSTYRGVHLPLLWRKGAIFSVKSTIFAHFINLHFFRWLRCTEVHKNWRPWQIPTSFIQFLGQVMHISLIIDWPYRTLDILWYWIHLIHIDSIHWPLFLTSFHIGLHSFLYVNFFNKNCFTCRIWISKHKHNTFNR